ncbi:MAG: Nif3-like dinuclear metal center hexameric protein [Deferribacteraceae bacterium]|jgi:dinuclear metal center YbgI/SA1388 family protein|nr:Nif3-like dinuclear metal center hexameric protein [Deferribacteraceae bacterium]
MSVFIDDVIKFIEDDFADIRRQSSWDFSGKQLYLGNRKVEKLCLALDPSESVIAQAVGRGCELLITHHPLFFTPQKGLNISKNKDRLVINAIKNDLTILSYHTNLDMAPLGINDYLLKLLNATDCGLLAIEGEFEYSKVTVFTPPSHTDAIIDAISAAGGGTMGNYKRCAFSVRGAGTFTPLEGANPYIGTVGEPADVEEARIEMIVPAASTKGVVAAIKDAHPYEHPAFDVAPINLFDSYGFGNVGELDREHSLDSFITLLKDKLEIEHIRTNMNEIPPFTRFAVSSGSGGTRWKECLKRKVEVLVTGDLKHHDALDAKAAGVCVIDVGHFASEHIYMRFFAEILRNQFDVEVILADEMPSIIDL